MKIAIYLTVMTSLVSVSLAADRDKPFKNSNFSRAKPSIETSLKSYTYVADAKTFKEAKKTYKDNKSLSCGEFALITKDLLIENGYKASQIDIYLVEGDGKDKHVILQVKKNNEIVTYSNGKVVKDSYTKIKKIE